MSKKIYFVGEGTVNGEKYNTDKFNQVIDPDTQEELFKDIYDITSCADFEKYEHKEDFMSVVIGMAYAALSLEGEVGNEIIVTAIDAQTDIFLWGVKLEIIDDDNFQYTTLDWKHNDILKYVEEDMIITIKQFVEELETMKDKEFVIECDNSHRIDFKFTNWKIDTAFEEDEEGKVMGEIVFGNYSHADMAINFDVINRVIKVSDGAYMLELKDGKSRVGIVIVAENN